MSEQERETEAVVGLSVYVVIGGETRHNVEPFELPEGETRETVDVDSYSDAVLRGIHDGLTSFDYVSDASTEQVTAFLAWIDATPGDGTENLGIIRGPEEGGTIPGGMTWNLDGMQWNAGGITRYAGVDCSVWPITVDAYTATFGEAP